MKFIKTFLLPLLLIVVCGLLLRSTYVEIKSRAIDQLNNQQLIMAETAARGIESFFEHYTELLTQLSKMSEIASFDERGRQLMQILYRTHANEIRGITRVGPSGQIIYTFPEIPGAIGTDLSAQEHVHKIIQTHQPVVSDVFDSIQGYMCIAFHVPVFRDEAFQGSLAVLIPFDQLSRKYLEPIKIGKDGYAWIISHKGIELYCPVPGHIGRSVFENCKDFPTILSMAQEMMRGHRGTTTYFFDRVRGETVESLKKQAVYVPVHLGNTFWSIVVATPEDEVLENIQGFRDRWFLIIGVLILTMIVWTSYLLRAFKILKEEEKRRRAEESLRMTNETLQAIVAASPVAIMTLDREGKVMKWSPAAERIFGWKEEEVIGRSNPIVPEDRIDEFRADFTRVIGGEKHPKAREMPSHKKDGSLIEISVSTAPLRDAKGEITGAVGIIDDITERKRAEEELNISSQRLSRAEIISRSGNWEFDLESQRVFASDGARKVYGLLDAEWTIPEVQKLPLPEYREMLDRALRELIQENRPYDVEFKIRRPDTGEIVDIRSVAEYDQNRKVVFGIIRDITLRKRAETALRESEARSMAFMEFIPALTLIKDHELKPIYANRKYREQFAFDDWFGKKPHETFPVEVAELIVRKDTEALQKGYTCYEETWLDKYQEPHVYQTQKFRIDIQDSEPLLGAIISDITDQKRMEQERQDLRERLYRAEKMEALGTLAGGVAHDLNNVLGVLVGYSELLLEKMPVDSPSRKYAANILKSGEWGAAIIQDLLTLARRGVAVSEVVNLNSIISDYFRTLEFERLQDDHPAVTFQTDLDKDLMNIKGSPVHLTKTLMNLLSNAAEAIEGGGEILIRTENRYLDRPVREYDKIPEGDYVVLKVTDNGKGISPADLGKIFEPFYTKKVMGRSGTGLGLAVVWGTVKDHGGFLDVQSDEGKGSTFTLYFPVTREELTREEQKISLDQYLGREESILVVDDVEGQRELAISMLTRLGYRVHAVSSGEEAVAYVKSHQVDLLVLDMIMEPGIDGLETYQRILEINPKQRAVIVSGFSETDRVKKAQSLGAGAYVKKPYVLEKLGLAVKRELVRAV